MEPQQDFAALRDRIETHNDLAEKYAIQVSHLRAGIALEADAWEALLTHLFGHCLVEMDGAEEFDNETLRSHHRLRLSVHGRGRRRRHERPGAGRHRDLAASRRTLLDQVSSPVHGVGLVIN